MGANWSNASRTFVMAEVLFQMALGGSSGWDSANVLMSTFNLCCLQLVKQPRLYFSTGSLRGDEGLSSSPRAYC